MLVPTPAQYRVALFRIGQDGELALRQCLEFESADTAELWALERWTGGDEGAVAFRTRPLPGGAGASAPELLTAFGSIPEKSERWVF